MPRWVLFLLFLISGATGLVYELIWTRKLILVFGGTTYAITTTLVAFMGGLGLGSYLAGRISRHLRRPGLVYGLLEIAIGVYALLVPLLLGMAEPLYRAMYPLVHDQPWLLTAARFVVGALVLAAPTTMMGATLPLLVRHITSHGGQIGRSVGTLYGVNTFGAAGGAMLAGFILIPWFGLITATQMAAAANIAVGLIAAFWLRSEVAEVEPLRAAKDGPSGDEIGPGLRRGLMLVFAISGFAAMVYQIMWTRTLVLSLGSSTYSFTCILAAFILGLALGALVIARFADRGASPIVMIGVVEVLIGLSAVLVTPAYGLLPYIMYDLSRDWGASAYEWLLAAEFAIAIAVTLVPTLLMGALFPLVTRALSTGRDDAGRATGKAYGINTLGTITGAFLAGFVLIRGDVLGVRNSVVLASVLNGLAGFGLLYATCMPRTMNRRLIPAAIALVLIPIVGLWVGQWNTLALSAGAFAANSPTAFAESMDIKYEGEGVDLNVIVASERGKDNLLLTVNATINASTTYHDMSTNMLMSHLPLLLTPKQENVCIIGLGCGVTLGSAAQHAGVKQLDCVEISQEVIHGAELFHDYNFDVLSGKDDRVRMILGDGRNHLLLTEQKYNVIISEPSHPWMAGIANLFTQEFFELCNRRLADDGLCLVWLHGYGMSVEDFRLVTRTLASVFPYVSVWELNPDDFALIAGRQPPRIPLSEVEKRFASRAVREDLYRVGMGDLAKLLGRFYTDGDALRAWAGHGPIHHDNHATLEFTTPRELLVGRATEITAGLLACGGSPFDELIVADQQAPEQAKVVSAVERTQKARMKRLEAAELREGNRRWSEWLRVALDGYQLDPGNMDLFNMIREAVALAMPGGQPSPGMTQADAELVNSLRRLREPSIVPPTGATLAELAARLRGQGVGAMQRGAWNAAVSYLNEAHELAPANRRGTLDLAFALTQDGRTDNAVALLRAKLTSGTVSAEDLRTYPAAAPLAQQEPIAALLADIERENGGD